MGKLKKIIPNLMIIVGALLLLAFLTYQAFNYPWKLLFAQWGWMELSEDLPNPSPLPDYTQDGDEGTLEFLDIEEMPSDGGFLISRPRMALTQLGIIKIPKIQISENVIEGSGHEMLYGVGHVRGTAMMGQEGNCVLASHRNYIWKRPFRYLDKVETGDKVYLYDYENMYTYEVFDQFVIHVNDTWILETVEAESHLLTLLTCTPPMVNDTPNRLIVWARLVDTQPLPDDFWE